MSPSDLRDLRDPWLVACWPGMGSVALLAGLHLVKALGAERTDELDGQGFFDPSDVRVEGGVLQPTSRPRNLLHAWRNPAAGGRDLLVFLAEAQPSSNGWAFAQRLLDHVRDRGVRRVVTFASLASPAPPGTPSDVRIAATTPGLLGELRHLGAAPLPAGEIGGMNGLLVAAAGARGMEGVCLLGSFPVVAMAIPNPTAAAAVLGAFAAMAGLSVDTAELETRGREVDQQLSRALEQVAERQREGEGEEKAAEAEEAEEPAEPTPMERLRREDRERIEDLFRQAARSREKAVALKAELDRLDVYRDYEDRFLDLFKRAE